MVRVRIVGLKVLTGQGAAIDTTSAQGKLVFGIFAVLAEFECELISEQTKAGLESARARGRKGGRPYKMTPAKPRLAMASMGRVPPRGGHPRRILFAAAPSAVNSCLRILSHQELAEQTSSDTDSVTLRYRARNIDEESLGCPYVLPRGGPCTQESTSGVAPGSGCRRKCSAGR